MWYGEFLALLYLNGKKKTSTKTKTKNTLKRKYTNSFVCIFFRLECGNGMAKYVGMHFAPKAELVPGPAIGANEK